MFKRLSSWTHKRDVCVCVRVRACVCACVCSQQTTPWTHQRDVATGRDYYFNVRTGRCAHENAPFGSDL